MAASAAAPAQQPADIEGTWRLASPQQELVPVGGGEPPLTEDGRTAVEANAAMAREGDFSFDQTRAYCSAPGLPRLMLMPGRFRIFQREGLVTMMFEWNRLYRQIDLRQGIPHEEPPVGTMNGVSFGHWEGDTLVVESFGFQYGKLLDDLLPGSDELRLVERIRLTDANTLEDRITITDPQMFTRPWETVLTFKRQEDGYFEEDLCLDRLDAGEPALPR